MFDGSQIAEVNQGEAIEAFDYAQKDLKEHLQQDSWVSFPFLYIFLYFYVFCFLTVRSSQN